MLRAGLTGGFATGKSFVGAELQRLGCHLIQADQLGHETLQPDGAAYAPAVALFGSEILTAEGTIDRKKLAAIVFHQPALLAKLNAVVHPAVRALEEKRVADIAARDAGAIVILEAAILVETGRYAECDKLIVTSCDRETQIQRGMKRDGATREEVIARLDKQLPLAEKIKYADYVIDTSGDKDDTVRQVAELFAELKRLAGTK